MTGNLPKVNCLSCQGEKWDLREHRRWFGSTGVHEGRVDVKHCVMEVCVGIGPSSSSKQPLPLAAAQECDMLHKMGNALLIFLLVHAS